MKILPPPPIEKYPHACEALLYVGQVEWWHERYHAVLIVPGDSCRVELRDIRYCPFCGRKLIEPDEPTEKDGLSVEGKKLMTLYTHGDNPDVVFPLDLKRKTM